jgi:hypothetical protein
MPPLYKFSAFYIFCQQNLAILYANTANEINDMPDTLRQRLACFIIF